MKKTLIHIFSIMAFTQTTQAAPYYEGPGCNEDGTRCIFGTPSGRVLNWSKMGTVEDLGERCEKFISDIENRKNEIVKERDDVVLQYRNFTLSWSRDLDSKGRAKLICSVELHSEIAHVKMEGRTIKTLNWVCIDRNAGGVCAHYLDECEAMRDEALKDKTILDATIYFNGSLLQGTTCDIVISRFSVSK